MHRRRALAAGDYSSLLQANDLRTRLERIIELRCGYPMRLRIISGTEESDWEDEKRREAAAQTARVAFRHRFEPTPAHSNADPSTRFTGRGVTWESLSERVNVMFSRAKGHHLPQGRVRYLKEVLPIVAEMSSQLMDAAPNEDAANERHLARVLEKVANLVETPSAVVALELARHQASQAEGEPETQAPAD